jgi:UDP-3-O-[3-hydroxymyristoyl] glucosamine N-acyltransferase
MLLSELANKINAQIVGDPNVHVTGVAPLDDATPNDVSFLANPKYAGKISTTKAAAVCVDAKTQPKQVPPGLNLLVCKDAYFGFAQSMIALVGFRKHPHEGIHPRAFVDPTATVGQGTIIYPNAYVGPRARVGSNCILYPGAVVYDDCILGDRVTLHANTVIGCDGYGYATFNGTHHKMPMPGIVILEDDVEIHSCTVIQRATMGATVIGKGTKMGDLIEVGHGTKTGQHCLLISQCGMAGSTTLGNYVVLAGQVGVTGHLTIGDFAKVGAQSGVMTDLDPKADYLGSPAQPIADARRTYVAMMQLPELVKRIRELEKKVAEHESGRAGEPKSSRAEGTQKDQTERSNRTTS